jgi:hypothetical protein
LGGKEMTLNMSYDGASRESLIHEIDRLEKRIALIKSTSRAKSGHIKKHKNTIKKLVDAGMKLIDQVETTGHSDQVGYKDEHGHDLRMNMPYQEFNNLVCTLVILKEEDK